MAGKLTEAARRRIDSAMLDSLSTWFAMRANGYPAAHSFNDGDVSEMLKRVSAIINPRPTALEDKP